MEWLSVKQYAKRKNVSEKTVRRMIDRGALTAEKVGRQWRIRLVQRDDSTAVDYRGHQEAVIYLLISASMDLKPLRNSFPTVFGFSYHLDDPSNGLHWVPTRGEQRVEWKLSTECDPGWQFMLKHLQSGLPNTLKALNDVKTSYGRYWKEISDRESVYRKRAKEFPDAEALAVSLDDSRFFRSILSEVDKGSSVPSEEDYEVTTLSDSVLVKYAGAGILSAASEVDALSWMHRHLDWRKKFVNVYKPELVDLHTGVRMAADIFIKAAEDIELRSRVPGECQICQAEQ